MNCNSFTNKNDKLTLAVGIAPVRKQLCVTKRKIARACNTSMWVVLMALHFVGGVFTATSTSARRVPRNIAVVAAKCVAGRVIDVKIMMVMTTDSVTVEAVYHVL